MVDASQVMFNDPQLATEMALTPDKLLMTQDQQNKQMQLSQQQKASWWQSAVGTVKDYLGKMDSSLSHVPLLNGAWTAAKDTASVAWYPIDKTAQGMRWAYSEGFSQPFSTLLLQSAKAEFRGEGWQNAAALLAAPVTGGASLGASSKTFFSKNDWAESYGQAEHLSPGQVATNYEMTQAASGDFGALSLLSDQVEAPNWKSRIFTGDNWKYTGPLASEDQQQVKRQKERFLVDRKYWEHSDQETYTKGSGALDFFFVLFGDPTTPFIGAASNAIKAGRSAMFVDDGLGLVRTRGNTIDVLSKKAPQTAEEYFTQDKNMNQFYDWVASPGVTGDRKTAKEIAAHPIWGGGRRVNPAKDVISEALAQMPRDDMNLALRYSAGDNTAAGALAAKSTNTLDTIGRLTENRVMLKSENMSDEMLSYFAAKEDAYPGTPVPHEGTQLFEPPTPRPAMPGPRQSGWDARWGELQAKADMYAQAASHVRGGLTGGVRPVGPVGGINADDLAKAKLWQSSQLDLVDTELKNLSQQDNTFAALLGGNRGKVGAEFEAGASDVFGTMDRAFRMGGLGLRSTEAKAEKNFQNSIADRKGRFVSQGYRQGFFGTPTRFIQSFGDRVPEGRVNHTESDASDRVLDMLKQVPALGAEQRAEMLNRYVTAGDKMAKSRMLDTLNTEIIHHMAGRVHGLDPEVAQILSEVTKVGIDATLTKLTKGSYRPTEQSFTAATRPGAQRSVDYVEDGVGWKASPLAVTQLESTDTLLPVLELNRAIERSSGALKVMRNAGATANDAVKPVLDSMNTVWKAATLLRPGYVPRMISEEAFASAIKFGFLSRLVADPLIGTKNFVANRGIQLAAITGHGSYVPATGAGLASKRAVVRLEDESIGQKALAYKAGLKQKIAQETDPYMRAQLEAEHQAIDVKKIRVSSALPIVQTRLSIERELSDNLRKDITKWESDAEALKGSSLGTDQSKLEALRMKVDDAHAQIADHENVIGEFTDYTHEILRSATNSMGKRMGEGTFEYGGQQIPQAFSKEWNNPISREQVSSQSSMQSMYARSEAVDVGRAARTGSWVHISPDKPEHMDSWLRALNFQFRQDDLFRLVAEDATGKKAASFLQTPAGRNHLRDLGPRARNGKQLIEDIKFTLDKYLPVDELQQKLARGEEVTAAELTGNIPKAEFPIVHGEEIKYLTKLWAKDSHESIVDRMIAGGFNRLGTIPSDLMSRNPVYSRFFEARMKTALGQDAAYKKSIGKDASYSTDELERMKDKADKLARKDISQIVYDPQRTMAGEALRYVFPFFNAHVDGLSRWAGLLGDKPEQFGKLGKIYNAPVAANLVTDKYGNVLDSDGTVTVNDPKTGEFLEKHKVNIEDRVLQLRLPWGKNNGAYPVKLSAINTILPGDPWFNPGSGPMVQIPASEIAKASPTVGNFLEWSKVLPYGPTDISTTITPKYMRAIYDRYKAEDPDGEAYQSAFLASYNRRAAEYHEKGTKFTIDDVKNDAKSFLNLQILESWGSPVQSGDTPLTGSPYQFYVDEYKKMQDVYGGDAKNMFMQKYGSEYFGFTSSLSKSIGIAASVSADAMAQKYKDLIDNDPDMAPFIIGNSANGGPFSSSVYKKQLEESFGSEWARQKITAKSAIEQNQIDQGWSEWNATKLQLDATLIRAGFTSYSQKGAEGLNAMKQQITENIGKAFPAWGNEFAIADRGKIPNRISAFERLSQDERLLSDPMRSEVKVLRYYLNRRELYKAALNERGGKQLSSSVSGEPSGENADIAAAWDHEVTGMINSNIAFNQLYNRYLTNDRLQ